MLQTVALLPASLLSNDARIATATPHQDSIHQSTELPSNDPQGRKTKIQKHIFT
jgi:hypothetical protein